MSDDPKGDEPPRVAASPARAGASRPRLNAVGEERPAFLLQYPDDPELRVLIRAFEAGDFAHVRKHAPLLMLRTQNPAVRRAARELRARIDPDPLLVVLLVFAISLFVFLVAWIYAH
jgi:hypothetical protein